MHIESGPGPHNGMTRYWLYAPLPARTATIPPRDASWGLVAAVTISQTPQAGRAREQHSAQRLVMRGLKPVVISKTAQDDTLLLDGAERRARMEWERRRDSTTCSQRQRLKSGQSIESPGW